jgi:hypothetical protein
MVDLKEYFYNTNHYADPIIKKFIYDFTDKFNPFLLIALNKQFVIGYLTEMDEMNELKVKKHIDLAFENLIGEEELEKITNILSRVYSYSNGVYKIEEVLEQYYNLSYSDHRDITTKTQDFRHCMQEIILWLNSNSVSQFNQQPTSDKADVGFNRNNWNKNTYELFNYLDENYDKKGNIKFINIFKFLKNVDKEFYAFNFTEEVYREFILNLKNLKITKFSTAALAYEDKELPILNAFEEVFRKEVLN